MAEYKDVRSSSPAKTPKLQLAAEQLSTGECWILLKKDTPRSRAKEKPQQDGRRGKITFTIKPHNHQRCSEDSNKPSAHKDPETPQRLSQNCISVSPVEVQFSSGQRRREGLWVQQTWVWHKPSWRRSPLTPPQSCQNLHRTGKYTRGGHKQNLVRTRTQEKGAVTPQETDQICL